MADPETSAAPEHPRPSSSEPPIKTPPFRIPVATYRLQLRREFPLEAASVVVAYLHELGVSDLCLSPLHTARAGSAHGYDVVDHTRLNPELGDAKALRQLLDGVDALGVGVVVDVMPNHMCIAGDTNALWMDVLEEGPSSAHAGRFDIDWVPPKQELIGKVLLPFLGQQYGHALEGHLSVTFDAARGRFFVGGEAGHLPLAIDTWSQILQPALDSLQARPPSEDAAVLELGAIVRELTETVPRLRDAGAAGAAVYRPVKQAIQQRLATLVEGSTAARAAVAGALATLNGIIGDPASFDALERLLDCQRYRLAHWRVAAHEINYRRFFDINDLAAIRVEDPDAFRDVHALPFEIARHPALTGFRVDHVDGLADPEGYLRDLAGGFQEARTAAVSAAGQAAPSGRPFVAVEKVLARGETLPSQWLADGTTGYDFPPILAQIFTHPSSAPRLRSVAVGFGGFAESYDAIAYQAKRLVLQTTLGAEMAVVARRLDRVSEQHRYTRDFTLHQLEAALGEIIACFPAYRTYVRRGEGSVDERDAKVIGAAVTAARQRNPLLNSSLFDFIEGVLLREDPPGLVPDQIEERRIFVERFQQLTAPVGAKGIEDTTFHRFLPLVALNEVGGDPAAFENDAPDAHEAIAIRQRLSPHTLSTTATDVTRWGEDTRARLYVLTEVADAWAAATAHWSAMTAGHKTKGSGNGNGNGNGNGDGVPDKAEEYLLYQLLVGTWPLGGWESEPDYADRIRTYMTRARHEAKTHTSWINPDPAYHHAADAYVQAVLDPQRSGDFLNSVGSFVATLIRPGLWNSLAQVLVKATSPGIPDFFQGSELWDFSFAEPDNRRQVDFVKRRGWLLEMLAESERRGAPGTEPMVASLEDGRIKLWTTAAALRLRRSHASLFEQGAYHPLPTRGAAAEHVFSFARAHEGACVVTLVGRYFARLGEPSPTGDAVWGDTRVKLPRNMNINRLRDALTGTVVTAVDSSLPLATVFQRLPIALLETIP